MEIGIYIIKLKRKVERVPVHSLQGSEFLYSQKMLKSFRESIRLCIPKRCSFKCQVYSTFSCGKEQPGVLKQHIQYWAPWLFFFLLAAIHPLPHPSFSFLSETGVYLKTKAEKRKALRPCSLVCDKLGSLAAGKKQLKAGYT